MRNRESLVIPPANASRGRMKNDSRTIVVYLKDESWDKERITGLEDQQRRK